MISSVQAGAYTIRGLSLGGIYTSLSVKELGVVLDAGVAPRSFASLDDWFISHGHVDHIGALPVLLGIRALTGKTKPPRLWLPAEIASDVALALKVLSRLQRYDLEVDIRPLEPGSVELIRGDLYVRAFRTYHPVPSLGYAFLRRVQKLKPEFADLPGAEIGRRRKAGEALFREEEHVEVAYATDTLVRVLDKEPWLYDVKVLILECTFLDERKSLETARAGCHVHMDELLERASSFRNQALVLMHFSQLYQPKEVPDIIQARTSGRFSTPIVPLLPRGGWPG